MPNLTATSGPFNRCATGACVDITRTADGQYAATSTLGDDRGRTVYDAAEIAAFLTAVKAGEWDSLHSEALAASASELTSA